MKDVFLNKIRHNGKGIDKDGFLQTKSSIKNCSKLKTYLF